MEIVIIGSGNLATQLGLALTDAGLHIRQVYSRTADHAKQLADKIGAGYTANIDEIDENADVYIMSVKDDAISEIASKVCAKSSDAVFLHTAGSISIEIFKGKAQHYGVLYPMQTFSKETIVPFTDIPIFLEADSAETLDVLNELARTLSSHVYHLSTDDRRYLHLAAVFACNFANHCMALSADVLGRIGIPFDVMLPLIDQTVRKLHTMSPVDAQTGPAVRHDNNVIISQHHLLDDNPKMQNVYDLLTNSIYEKSTNK